ncbi:MAG: TetR/AcrR family transcriptional regulator [Pseudomonadota bacterium]
MKEKRSKARLSADRRIKEITLIAELIIVKNGFKDLTLQEVIEQSSISRGTFFKLIPNKETLIAHLGVKGLNFWLELINKTKDFDGLAREKLLILHASQVIASKLNRITYHSIFIANAALNRFAVAPELNLILDDRVNELIQFYNLCIQLGINEGSFPAKDYLLNTEELAYFMWANRYGATVCNINYVPHNNDSDLSGKYKKFVDMHLDSMEWRPLSTEVNYSRVLLDIYNQYYKKEIAQIKKYALQDEIPSITQQEF